MNVAPFLKILNRAVGLAPDSLSRSGIELAVRARMRETATTEKSYLGLIRTSDKELAELVEEIVVPETWFSGIANRLNFFLKLLPGVVMNFGCLVRRVPPERNHTP